MAKIYLVEDDQAIKDVLEIFLTLEDHVVRSFGTVQEFSQRDLSEEVNLYLFDVMLPDGSGIDLCYEIKNDQEMKDLCHPDSFVSKPFDIDNLLLHIKRIILKESRS